ncbi:MAG: hypothetical protein NZL93_06200, partial [Chthoniobacterales bacterium]|nr:hypothetical protein [Chthoniobacterales bacterium]
MLGWNLGIVMAIFVVLIGGWGFWQAEPEEWLLEGLFARMVSKVSGEGSGGGLFMALVEWVWRSYGVFAAAKVAAGWGMVEGVFFLLLAGMVGILVDRFLWRGWGWVVLVTVAGVMFVKSVRDEFRWSKFTLKKDKNIEIFKALDAL